MLETKHVRAGWRAIPPALLALLFGAFLVGSAPVAGAPASEDRTAVATGPAPQASGAGGIPSQSPGKPAGPLVVLYDQYNNLASTGTTSQNFETAYNQYDAQAADNFVVPTGQSWSINQLEIGGLYSVPGGPASSVNVFFYTNSGVLPATPVYSQTNLTFIPGASYGDLVVNLTSPANLPAGTFWLSVQVNQNYGTNGQWYWRNRLVASYSAAAWRNPTGGFGTVCTGWGTRGSTCAIQAASPDQVFRLSGTQTLATPTPTVCPVVTINGSINNYDQVLTGRFNRSVASGCNNPTGCPGVMDQLQRHYDSYIVTNNSADITCVNITLNMAGCAGLNPSAPRGAAFLDSSSHVLLNGVPSGPANPLDLCATYLADSGYTQTMTATYSVFLSAGESMEVIVNEADPNLGCAAYSLTVRGCVSVTASCPLQFTDVPPSNGFYPYVRCLVCRNILSGYPCGGPDEPCDVNNSPYFRPQANITRGQIAKIVSNSAGFTESPGSQIFEDVPPESAFYVWINRLANRGIMSGYACGGPGEPCVPPYDRHYFRPGANATRGQLSKIVSNAAGYQEAHSEQTFEDVPLSHVFYIYIQRLSSRFIINGYACGSVPEEPCVPPDNRHYFRPSASVTRAQSAKIVTGAFFPDCATN